MEAHRRYACVPGSCASAKYAVALFLDVALHADLSEFEFQSRDLGLQLSHGPWAFPKFRMLATPGSTYKVREGLARHRQSSGCIGNRYACS